MPFKWNSEMSRYWKNLATSINRKRKREIESGRLPESAAPGKLTVSAIRGMVEKSARPQEMFDALASAFSQLRPSENPGAWQPVKTSKGQVRGIQGAESAKEILGRKWGKVRKEIGLPIKRQRRERMLEKAPKSMPPEQVIAMADAISESGGNISEFTIPPEATLDEMVDFVSSEDLGSMVDRYLEIWQAYALSPEFFSVIENVHWLEKNSPSFLMQIFNSGDEETTVEFIYDKDEAKRERRKGRDSAIKYADVMISRHQKIVNYWKSKVAEARRVKRE